MCADGARSGGTRKKKNPVRAVLEGDRARHGIQGEGLPLRVRAISLPRENGGEIFRIGNRETEGRGREADTGCAGTRVFNYEPRSGAGSTGFAFLRISKWSCGWLASPVEPALATTCPRFTTSHFLTMISSVWA